MKVLYWSQTSEGKQRKRCDVLNRETYFVLGSLQKVVNVGSYGGDEAPHVLCLDWHSIFSTFYSHRASPCFLGGVIGVVLLTQKNNGIDLHARCK